MIWKKSFYSLFYTLKQNLIKGLINTPSRSQTTAKIIPPSNQDTTFSRLLLNNTTLLRCSQMADCTKLENEQFAWMTARVKIRKLNRQTIVNNNPQI